MSKPKRPVIAACATALILLGAGSAFGGEITGNGKYVPGGDTGRSACSFSGREDEPGDPLFRGLIAQSWGQIPKAIRDMLPAFLHPGTACNPGQSQGE